MSGTISTESAPAREKPVWRDAIEPYEKSSWSQAAAFLLTSLLPWVALTALMFVTLSSVPWWVTGLIALPTGGFLVRVFIVFHDATHGSFVPDRKANDWIGRICGVLVFNPFLTWKDSHQRHHGSAGDLDRRGQGDVPTLTIDEYNSRSFRGRLGYRLFRNPLVMFGLGPIVSMIIGPRLLNDDMRPALRRSVIRTNLALLAYVAGLVWVVGWQAYLAVMAPTLILAGAFGIWLFYVQHQYEDVYWERSENWDFAEAALKGSSYLKLPRVLQFFSGNIGFHHVHHLSARVPNYNLQRAAEEIELFREVPVLTFGEALRCSRFKLIDDQTGRLYTFSQAREITARRAVAARPSSATAA